MARQPRIEYPGAYYHVMCRGDRREAIFLGERGLRAPLLITRKRAKSARQKQSKAAKKGN